MLIGDTSFLRPSRRTLENLAPALPGGVQGPNVNQRSAINIGMLPASVLGLRRGDEKHDGPFKSAADGLVYG
jgi:hypothetical protein